MRKIKVIIKRPDEPAGHVTNISASMENLQRTVGGYIETIFVRKDMVILVNEEAKISMTPEDDNFFIPGDVVRGTAIICGFDGEEFTDVPIPLAFWKDYLREWRNCV